MNGKDHAALADEFNRDESRVDWHDQTLWWIRQKRDKAAHQVPDWEQLRETASAIKENVLSDLNGYLRQFEEEATRNGITVHVAPDPPDPNALVPAILHRTP